MEALVEDFLLESCFKVGSEIAQVVELEVYQSPDPYIHELPEQKLFGHWYFHRSSSTVMSPWGFKGGNYKGLDFTFGSEDSDSYGGILIRSLMTPDGLVEGPSRVVDYILAKTGCTTIADLVKLIPNYPPRCDDVNFPLHILSTERRPDIIYSGPRVGLTYRSDPESKKYFGANLRFTTYPKLQKNKFSLVLSFLYANSGNEISEQQIYKAMTTFNTTEKNIHRWLADFGQGMSSDSVADGSSVPDQCRIYGFLWSSI